jgi:hypothetical protein
MSDDIATWCGKRIDDMTRDELIVALKHAGRLYHAHITASINDAKYIVAGKIAEWSKGRE